MTLREKLEKLRAGKGWSNTEIARRVGVSKSTVSDWFGGKNPSLEGALDLARAFGVPLDYLADPGQEEPPASELPEDERMILKLYRSLGIDEAEALRRLSGDRGATMSTSVEAQNSRHGRPA